MSYTELKADQLVKVGDKFYLKDDVPKTPVKGESQKKKATKAEGEDKKKEKQEPPQAKGKFDPGKAKVGTYTSWRGCPWTIEEVGKTGGKDFVVLVAKTDK